MPGDNLWSEDPNDEPLDEDGPESDEPLDENGIDDDQSETVPCPECGAEVYEDAVQCPVCGTYLSAESSPWHGRPIWWILLGLVGTGALIYALTMPG